MSTDSSISPLYCLLGGFLIGTGIIVGLIEIINDSEEWTLRIIGISSIIIGIILILLYIKCKRKQLNALSSSTASTTKFIKVDIPPQSNHNSKITQPQQRLINASDYPTRRISPTITPVHSTQYNTSSTYVPSSNHIEHYKPRHFAGHGCRSQVKSAPLACQEDITPSLRSSFNSLYLLERSSESDTSSINSMIYVRSTD